MTEFERIIETATELAYEEDANQVVGKIQGEWAIAHNEDFGRRSEMSGEVFEVNSSGII